MHPLYDDEAQVHHETAKHMHQGRTVFQLWQVAPNERDHSVRLLDMVAPGHRARVLSLGCGVGGMERYWQIERPDMLFTLVNASKAQLDLCVCDGERVLMDAHDFKAPAIFDVVVLAYALGHMRVPFMLQRAKHMSARCVLVVDVFDASPAFTRAAMYEAPEADRLRQAGFVQVKPPVPWTASPVLDDMPEGLRKEATPMIWMYIDE